jgi:hypothetical protein
MGAKGVQAKTKWTTRSEGVIWKIMSKIAQLGANGAESEGNGKFLQNWKSFNF